MDNLKIKQFQVGSMGEIYILTDSGIIYEGELHHIGVGQKKIVVTQKVEIDLSEINNMLGRSAKNLIYSKGKSASRMPSKVKLRDGYLDMSGGIEVKQSPGEAMKMRDRGGFSKGKKKYA